MKKLLPLILLIILCPVSFATGYDGTWFLGFNTNKDVFGGRAAKAVRQAFNLAVDRKSICRDIIGDSNIPTGIIPKGMDGYDASLKGYPHDINKAVSLLKKAGYSRNDRRLKELVLIHTDGVKTVKIARRIASDLKKIGVTVRSKQVRYSQGEDWEEALSKGKFHMFLMGYKLLPEEDVPTSEALSTQRMLKDLFHTDGEANFFSVSDKKLDSSIERIDLTPTSEAASLTAGLKALNKYLQDLSLTVNLFYIEKIPGLSN